MLAGHSSIFVIDLPIVLAYGLSDGILGNRDEWDVPALGKSRWALIGPLLISRRWRACHADAGAVMREEGKNAGERV